jgi:hypothetical protein
MFAADNPTARQFNNTTVNVVRVARALNDKPTVRKTSSFTTDSLASNEPKPRFFGI